FAEIVSTATGEILKFDIMNPTVFFGALVGVAMPAVFCALLIFGVNKNSQKLVKEIHRQFNETEGLKEGKVEPDYSRCINIATVEILKFDIMNPTVFFGALVGVAMPAVFCALLIFGVNKNSQKLVKEIHRQFNETEGLKEGKVEPDYSRCINIATVGAIKELIPAGLISILATLVVGFIGGVQAVGGFLTGNILSGLLLAMLMSNSGGLWDN